MIESEEKYALLKEEKLKDISNIPDNINEIKKNPIAKPLLEFIKQRDLIKASLRENLNYHKDLLNEFTKLLEVDYIKDLEIVRVTQKIIEIYKRMIVCLNQAENIAEDTLKNVYEIYQEEKRNERK